MASALHLLGGGTLLGPEAVVVLPAMAVVMLAVGLLASLGPARRSLGIQPIDTLRAEQ